MKLVHTLALFAALLLGCPPSPINPPPDANDGASPVPPTTPDAGPVLFADSGPPTACTLACVNLNKLGCPEGLDPNCVNVCNHAQGQGVTNLKPDCLANATTVAAAKACGTVTCAPAASSKKK